MSILKLARPDGKPLNRSEDLVRSLADKLRRGELAPGSRLPTEPAIMAEFGFSRTVVREALSRLQAAGLVETRHGVGTFVLARPDDAGFQLNSSGVVTMLDVMAMLELRIGIESEAARLAAGRRTVADLEGMSAALEDFEAHIANRSGDTIPADVKFHSLIARATGNRHFQLVLTKMEATIIPRTRVNVTVLTNDDHAVYLGRIHREHEAIFDAIAGQDCEAAYAAMYAHLVNSRDRIRRRAALNESS